MSDVIISDPDVHFCKSTGDNGRVYLGNDLANLDDVEIVAKANDTDTDDADGDADG